MTATDGSNGTVASLDSAWSVAGASLYRAEDAPGEPERFGGTLGASALSVALSRATETVRASPPDAKGYAVPLHEPDGPGVTDEYVLWRPESEQFGWYDTGFGIDGTVRFVDVAEAARTTIADRLRLWHPDETPPAESGASHATTDGASADDTAAATDSAGLADDSADADGGAGVGDSVEVPPNVVEPESSRSTAAVDAFFADLHATVDRERDAARRANRARHENASLDALVDEGVADGPFVSLGRANREDHIGEFVLQRAEGAAKDALDQRTGPTLHRDSVVLVDSDDRDPDLPLAVRTTRVDGPVVRVKPARAGDVPLERFEALISDRDRDFYVAPLLNPVPFERRTDALDALADDAAKRELFATTRSIQFDADTMSTPSTPLELNAYQERALKWAEDAQDVALVHGPPGTGKTRTLTAYVLHAASRGERVLVTAHSNQAVDNLLVGDSTLADPEPDTVHAFASGEQGDLDVDVARVGRQSANDVVNQHYASASVANADVVAATTNGAARFDTDAFDVGIVDEATQASRPATAIVVDASEKVVLAGDHRQLPPYAAVESGANRDTASGRDTDNRRSWFEDVLDAYGDDVAVLLGRQYRMHDAIAAFPNDAFYDGRLETAARNAGEDWRLGDRDPLVAVDVYGPERGEVGGDSTYNPREVDVVVDEVANLLAAGVDPSDVGVIAMYSAQVDRIRAALRDRDGAGTRRVTVDTVDSFQGGEREAIVVSFVRSNTAGRSGFLETPEVGPRRLNVALTRARKRLVLVGDWGTLAAVGPDCTSETSAAHHYRALRDRLDRDDLFVDPDHLSDDPDHR